MGQQVARPSERPGLSCQRSLIGTGGIRMPCDLGHRSSRPHRSVWGTCAISGTGCYCMSPASGSSGNTLFLACWFWPSCLAIFHHLLCHLLVFQIFLLPAFLLYTSPSCHICHHLCHHPCICSCHQPFLHLCCCSLCLGRLYLSSTVVVVVGRPIVPAAIDVCFDCASGSSRIFLLFEAGWHIGFRTGFHIGSVCR